MVSERKKSAGILLFHFNEKEIQFFLVHPGGPFWAKKDEGAWSIPKGEFISGEEPLAAAKREFLEETGFEPQGKFIDLGSVKQKSGKLVYAWAVEGYLKPEVIKSNMFEMEWPPRSGKKSVYPEVDKAGWFTPAEARKKINPAQAEFLDILLKLVKV